MILCGEELSMAKTQVSRIEQYVIDVVKRKREERGMSQRELAAELEKSTGFIGDIESPKERAKYNLNHLNDLAKVFNCSPRDFLPEKPFK
jgi:ribosome-binding protein aMBF1 (putative translation factor)